MIWVGRIIAGGFGLLFALIGARTLIDPGFIMAQFELGQPGLTGQSAIRADIGGFFLGGGLFALTALLPGRRHWLLGGVTLLGLAFTGRAIGVLAQGTTGKITEAMLVEAVSIALLLFAYTLLKKDRDDGTAPSEHG